MLTELRDLISSNKEFSKKSKKSVSDYLIHGVLVGCVIKEVYKSVFVPLDINDGLKVLAFITLTLVLGGGSIYCCIKDSKMYKDEKNKEGLLDEAKEIYSKLSDYIDNDEFDKIDKLVNKYSYHQIKVTSIEKEVINNKKKKEVTVEFDGYKRSLAYLQ